MIGAYPQEKNFVVIIKEAVEEEMKSIIPNFDIQNIKGRQKLIYISYIQEFYDNREAYESSKTSLRDSIKSMLMKESFK